MKVHLEGMGINGCLTALMLQRFGVDFTWHDIYRPTNAWSASTGAIYPAGSSKFGPDHSCWLAWQQWFDECRVPCMERGRFWFANKGAPPHEGRYDSTPPNEFGLRVAEPTSLHLNAQEFVPWIRERFHHLRKQEAQRDAELVIRSHSWTERLDRVYWGWTRLVKLELDQSLRLNYRPAIYMRPSRVVMAYAYPVPGTEWWYAGSSIIQQKAYAAKSLVIAPKYDRWKRNFEALTKGAAKVVEEGPMLEGWRPAASHEDSAWIRRRGNVLTVRPLWNSGIRHYPKQWAGIASSLGIKDKSLEVL